MTTTDGTLSISQVAEATGLTSHTLRYYEREGLMLVPVDRASSTHRRFTSRDVDWLVFLTRRSLGVSSRSIRKSSCTRGRCSNIPSQPNQKRYEAHEEDHTGYKRTRNRPHRTRTHGNERVLHGKWLR
ncbi:MAG: MerR family transcriptional regulator [Rhodoglobus sp.]